MKPILQFYFMTRILHKKRTINQLKQPKVEEEEKKDEGKRFNCIKSTRKQVEIN